MRHRSAGAGAVSATRRYGMANVDFWYEFASTYSYPAAMRVEALAAARGINFFDLASGLARADLRSTGLARLALQYLPCQGPLHVA